MADKTTFMNRPIWERITLTTTYAIGGLILVLMLTRSFFPSEHHHSPKMLAATLEANLTQLRNAIDQFQADTGVYPVELLDIVAEDASHLKTKVVPPGVYKGPYLVPLGGIGGTGIPMNPYGPPGASATIATHWVYTPADGTVKSKVTGTTLDNESYTDL